MTQLPTLAPGGGLMSRAFILMSIISAVPLSLPPLEGYEHHRGGYRCFHFAHGDQSSDIVPGYKSFKV
jgi:hypothetical protein